MNVTEYRTRTIAPTKNNPLATTVSTNGCTNDESYISIKVFNEKSVPWKVIIEDIDKKLTCEDGISMEISANGSLGITSIINSLSVATKALSEMILDIENQNQIRQDALNNNSENTSPV